MAVIGIGSAIVIACIYIDYLNEKRTWTQHVRIIDASGNVTNEYTIEWTNGSK